jgi:hypothetical protein
MDYNTANAFVLGYDAGQAAERERILKMKDQLIAVISYAKLPEDIYEIVSKDIEFLINPAAQNSDASHCMECSDLGCLACSCDNKECCE